MNRKLNKKKEKGIALVLVLIFLALLSSLGLWLTMTSIIELKTTEALKNYEEVFYLADGASQLSLRYLAKNVPPPPGWDPTNEGQITNLPTYLDEKSLQGGKEKLKPIVLYKGYSTKPPPGWELNWQGYYGFHPLRYIARGQGELPTKGSKSTVDVIILRITR